MNFKQLNEQLKTFLESNLPEFQKMDKLCDLDKHLSESGRYIGMKDSKYGIYRYTRTTQKFNGSWNYDYKLISPEFDEELDAIDWLAQDLLSRNSKQDFIDCIEEGSFKIYNDNLKTIMELDVEEGTLNTNPKFPTGDNKGIDPVPNYMLEPNKAKANNLRREYVQTHGKTYESLNEKVPTWAEGGPLLVPVEEKPREKKDYEKRIDEIRQEIADILKDVPESEDVPKAVKEGWGDSIEKWVKVEFTSEAPWHKEWIDKVEYAWFGVVKPNSTHFKPLVLLSKNRDYHLNGGGWDYFSCKWSDDKRWLPIMEDALKAVKAKFGK